jgi:hypothetical protein
MGTNLYLDVSDFPLSYLEMLCLKYKINAEFEWHKGRIIIPIIEIKSK